MTAVEFQFLANGVVGFGLARTLSKHGVKHLESCDTVLRHGLTR